MTVVVYKLGGSLLSLPGVAERLADLLANSPESDPLLIVGGGPAADLVRDWDRRHDLGQERSHCLALEAMRLNEALLLELLPSARTVSDRNGAVRTWEQQLIPVLNARDFLCAEEPTARCPLSHSWEATSDTIAAWVALNWPADRLVLLKSCRVLESQKSLDEDFGPEVDTAFPTFARQLDEVMWCNLRENPPLVVPWKYREQAE
jgi:aspartokinase-like uncharacterized kinase